eukprot:TRINITY_DN5100_c0_g1_i10.p2 TRINITY_DN5100_c0_g1~~TRINITY_DN5100_c0_g1_i10.p2  ORF type:complete len:192 (+),score=9.34 TRINITY_DN5100_c0_g1_i10:55-630(+)
MASPRRAPKKRALPEASAHAAADSSTLSDFFREKRARRHESCFYLHKLILLGETLMDGQIEEIVKGEEPIVLPVKASDAALPPPTLPGTSGPTFGLLGTSPQQVQCDAQSAALPTRSTTARPDVTANHWGSPADPSGDADLPAGTPVVVDNGTGRMRQGTIGDVCTDGYIVQFSDGTSSSHTRSSIRVLVS